MTPEDERPDDVKIGAWLDGELGDDGATGMNFSSATNEAFAARAERLRQIDGLVRAAVPEEEALPEELLARLGLSDSKSGSKIVSFAAARRAREARAANEDTPGKGWFQNSAPWRMAAQVALVIGVGLGGILLIGNPGSETTSEGYRTLSDKVAPAELRALPTNAIVIFAGTTDAKSARQIVASAGGQLVGAPNETGAWKVAIAPSRRDDVLATLRQDKRVALAEPLEGGVR